MSAEPRRILFVCLGNICRSPLAEAVMQHLVTARGLSGYVIDSAGTSGWHNGEPADSRTIDVGRRNGIPVGSQSRALTIEDFDKFDLLIAMDHSNRSDMLALQPADSNKIRMLRDWDPAGPGPVPDPYYGGPQGFDDNYAMVLRCCEALLNELEA